MRPSGKIRIDDLRRPVLSAAQQAALAAAAQARFDFSAQAIMDAARHATGLGDFGASDFVERLELWCRCILDDDGLSAVSHASLWGMMLRYASDRLRVEDMVRRNPEILDIAIDRPIIVAGLPRSGTTHLLGLLGADERLRSLPWWEAIAPVPGPQDAPRPDDPNPRWTRAHAGWEQYRALLPLMEIMHEFSPDHVSEDIELQALDFSSYLLEWLAYAPRWRDHYLSRDQSGTYAYLKKAMQVLTLLKGPNRWVIKCPQHMEQLPALRRTFPDATYVITHRDPVASITSAMTMALYASRVLRTRTDPEEPKRYWIDRFGRLLRACVRDRAALPDEQTIDIYFHQWIGDPDRHLHDIYAKAGLPIDDATIATLKSRHAAHDPGGRARIDHSLERDFGINAAAIREQFGFYFDRFPVAIEAEG